MEPAQVIVLLTDFGLKDGYVGIMKGVIAKINPEITVIDLSHDIAPQDIGAARFVLLSAVNYFPPGSIFVVVVDPGVGSQRRSIALAWGDYFLIAPDNGVLSGLLARMPGQKVISLTNRDYWRVRHPSFTFQGRDVFAPVAAHLARGVPLDRLGDPVALDSLVGFPLPELEMRPAGVVGSVQYLDHFGNGITTIPFSLVEGKSWVCRVGKTQIVAGNTYSAVEVGEAIALIGSEGWVEIAVNGGSAQDRLNLKIGDRVELLWSSLSLAVEGQSL
jgi:S-adenosylmethionine hydrolase